MNNVIKNVIKDIKKQKNIIYRPPLPLKKQRVTMKGRSGKCKIYTQDEIFVYKCRKAFTNGNIELLV